MKSFFALVKTETQLQWRSGFFLVAMIITILWSVILQFVPDQYVNKSLGLVLSLDVASIALLSCIGMHILEMRQNVANALLVTPMDVPLKIAARIGFVSILSAVTSLVIAFPFVAAFDLLLLFLVSFCNSLLYSVIGYLLAAFQPNISRIIVSLGFITPIWFLPYLEYLNLYSHPALSILPTYGITQMFGLLDAKNTVHPLHLVSWLLWFAFFGTWLIARYRSLVIKG